MLYFAATVSNNDPLTKPSAQGYLSKKLVMDQQLLSSLFNVFNRINSDRSADQIAFTKAAGRKK